MPANRSQELLEFANVQMAAEAFLKGFNPDTRTDVLIEALRQGNGRASAFPTALAEDFADKWVVIDHQPNTAGSGFSGTLFRRRTADANGKYEYTLSFRSTEFVDDAIRDAKGAGNLEVRQLGWAFGQISDMEKFYARLKSEGKLPSEQTFNVTGYSLGGHLALAFALLRREEGKESLLKHVYTFNGAGTGGLRSQTLTTVTANFDRFRTPAGLDSLNALASNSDRQAAQSRVDEINAEYARILGFKDTFLSGSPATGDYSNFIYQLAAVVAGRDTIASSAFPRLWGDISSIPTEREFVPEAQQFSNMTEIFGSDGGVVGSSLVDGTFSFVSMSGLHYSRPANSFGVYVEDQPLTRGSYSIVGNLAKLAENPKKNDFADTHSLVLLVDSLALMSTMTRLDPNLTQTQIQAIFKTATNSSKQTVSGTQGKAEGNTLETTLDALRRILMGGNVANTLTEAQSRRALEGGTWADRDLDLRAPFHANLRGLNTTIDQLKSANPSNQYTIQSLSGLSPTYLSSTAQVNDDQGKAYRYALKNLNPFVLVVNGTQPQVYNDAAYAKYDRDSNAGGLTDQYLEDRATMIYWLAQRNTVNADDIMPSSEVTGPVRYTDLKSGADGKTTTFRIVASGDTSASNVSPDSPVLKRFVFGTDSTDLLQGGPAVDRMYGGAGRDFILSGSSSDYLEGGAGLDVYGYNASSVLGFGTNDGDDTIRDADGKGALRYVYSPSFGATRNKVIGGIALKVSGTQWQSVDGNFTYAMSGSDLTVTINGDAGGTLTLKDYRDGDFGIRLRDAPAASATTRTISGDLAPLDSDPNEPGVQTTLDDLGNVVLTTDPAPGRVDMLNDSTGNDLVEPGAGDDFIAASRGGDDWLKSGAGRDDIVDTGGNNYIEAGSNGTGGGDIVFAGAGNDTVFAGDAPANLATALAAAVDPDAAGTELKGDFISTTGGNDLVLGGADNDILAGGGGGDLLVGGAGNDIFFADSNARATTLDWTATRITTGLYTKPGADDFVNLVGVNDLTDDPQAGADTIYAGAGNDWANAGAGDDILDMGSGNDFAFGDSGDDILVGGAGDDILDGDYATSTAAQSGNDYLDGGAGDDWLFGRFGEDILIGADGVDRLDGGEGDDILWGGTGDDTLLGGAGKDKYVYFRGDGADVIQDPDIGSDNAQYRSSLVLGPEITRDQVKFRLGSLMVDVGGGDAIHFEGFDPNNPLDTPVLDSIQFADGTVMTYADILAQGFEVEGTEGDDDIEGTNLNERIDARGGDDIVRAIGGNDTVSGGAGADVLHGGDGDDTLDGGTEDDALFGEEGADSLIGGAGDDLLDGGTGSDTLAGGEGADSYFVYGGMGADRATDGEGGEKNVLGLAPGMSVAGLRFTRMGDALEVGVKGTTDTFTIEDYYTRAQAWAIRDVEGNETELEDALTIPDPNVGNFVAQLREEARAGQLARAGGAMLLSGWKPLGGNLFEGVLDQAFLAHVDQTSTETFTRVDPPQDVLATYITHTLKDTVLEIGTTGAPFLKWQQHRLVTALIQSDAALIGPGNALPDLVAPGQAVVTLRREIRRGNEQHSVRSNSGGVVSYDTGSEVVLASVFHVNEINAWNQLAAITKVDEPLAETWGHPLAEIVGARALVNMQRIENRYLNVVEIVGGDSANEISAVSGGAGIFSVLSLVDGGAGEDAITGAGFLYGNLGDDTITGGGTLIGGYGDDTLSGTGRFVFTAEETGIDTVSAPATYVMEYLQWFYGATNLEEQYRHGGDYRLDVEGGRSYYETLAEAEAVQQGYGFGSIVQIEPLGAAAPVVRIDDTGTLDQLVAAGAMPRDVAEFGPGLTIEDLQLTLRGGVNPLEAGETLSVRWNGGDAGFDLDVPDANYGMVGTDVLFDLFGDGEEAPPSTYRLGEGVETFRFADGTSYSIADILALAGLEIFGTADGESLAGGGGADVLHGEGGDDTLEGGGGDDLLDGGSGADTYVLAPGGGHDTTAFQVFSSATEDRLLAAEGLAPEDVMFSRDHTDLTAWIRGTEDRIDVSFWFASTNFRLAGIDFADGTFLHADEIEALLEPAPGTDEDDVIFGSDGDDVIDALAGVDEVYGEAGDDTIDGGEDEDFVAGGPGIDLARGGEGDDELEDFEDAGLLDGGAGEDFFYEGGNGFVIGGAGDDYLGHYGDGGVIAFNPGDGHDTVYAAGAMTLSIGGGITTADLALTRDLDDLVLAVGAADSIRLTREFELDPQAWPAITLQLFGSVHTYDLTASIDGSIEDFHLADSETEALGGALAWQYATAGNLNSLTDADIRTVLTDPGFGITPQPIEVGGGTGNSAPVLASPLADQAAAEDSGFSFTVPAGTFSDPDAGDALVLSASRADGQALPAWLSFDANTATFSGAPGNGDVGLLGVRVTATDAAGASASTSFDLTVVNTNDAPVTGADSAAVSEDGVLAASGNVLANDTDVDAGSVLSVAVPGTFASAYGSLALAADGAYTYTLDSASAGETSTLELADGLTPASFKAEQRGDDLYLALREADGTLTALEDALALPDPSADVAARQAMASYEASVLAQYAAESADKEGVSTCLN